MLKEQQSQEIEIHTSSLLLILSILYLCHSKQNRREFCPPNVRPMMHQPSPRDTSSAVDVRPRNESDMEYHFFVLECVGSPTLQSYRIE